MVRIEKACRPDSPTEDAMLRLLEGRKFTLQFRAVNLVGQDGAPIMENGKQKQQALPVFVSDDDVGIMPRAVQKVPPKIPEATPP